MAELTSDDPDEYAVLAATWIMASNDENPIITYKGIIHRIGLPNSYNIIGLIRKHGELFRSGVPKSRLDTWKEEMRSGNHMAGWIRDIGGRDERIQAIDSITVIDVFRSQFRVEKNAPKSPIEIIDWGLQHIDRLRKAKLESKEQLAKSREVILAIIISGLNVFFTLVNLYFTYRQHHP